MITHVDLERLGDGNWVGRAYEGRDTNAIGRVQVYSCTSFSMSGAAWSVDNWDRQRKKADRPPDVGGGVVQSAPEDADELATNDPEQVAGVGDQGPAG